MEKIIHSKSLVLGLPASIFLINLVLTAFGGELIEVTSPWMHFAGGFSMGLLFLHFWGEDLKSIFFAIITTAAFAVLIGVWWEFAEFFYDWLFSGTVFQFPLKPTWEDTLADLFLDFLGGLLSALFFQRKIIQRTSL